MSCICSDTVLLFPLVHQGYKGAIRGDYHGHLCGGNDGRKVTTSTPVIRLCSIMGAVLSSDLIQRKSTEASFIANYLKEINNYNNL